MANGVTCPHCKRTSYHSMDVFFQWCPGCKCAHGEVEYRDEDRHRLGEIHRENPSWSLQRVVDSFK